MLAAGIKPWSHAFSLLRRHLLHLHEVVNYPSSRVEILNRRVSGIESELSQLRRLVALKKDVSLLRDGIDVPLTQLSRNMRRFEKKEEHLRLSAEDKFNLMESRLEDLREYMRHSRVVLTTDACRRISCSARSCHQRRTHRGGASRA